VASLIDEAPARPVAGPRALHVHFSPRMFIVSAVLIAVPWAVVVGLAVEMKLHRGARRGASTGEESVETSPRASLGKPGAWGQLEYVRFNLEVPDEFVFVPSQDHPPIRWFFKGYTRDRAAEFLSSAGLTPAQLDVLLKKATWEAGPEGAAVTPGDELILGLSPAARAKIYSLLVEFPENNRQIDPIYFRPELLDERLANTGLSSPSLELLNSLLYKSDSSLLLFADFEPALRRLQDGDERQRFMKTVSRKPTLLARLKIDAESDTEALANYWGVGGRKKDLEPLLKALKSVDGGCRISIMALMPRFVREHLYNHPFTAPENATTKQDCFWSAMNFFNDQPDDRFNDMTYVGQVIDRDYYKILEPSQLGDVIFVATQKGTVVHAAAYLADDIVFTKNGAAYTQPWILMHLQDMVDSYSVHYPTSGPMQVLYYRKKSL
jgi:hypothetical protein